ncbi:MAG: VIT domain-containing protein [Candidatus Melainabacteria bacterium]|nr:VIT domain-containing protein [Candidatus Melainabacteria bacterium]
MMVDPIPTIYHVGLVGFVAFANILALFCSLNQTTSTTALAFARWCLGVAAGISIYYSVTFLPVYPMAILACIIIFLAPFVLLGFSPPASLVGTILCWKLLNRIPQVKPAGYSVTAIVFGISLLLFIELPSSATRLGMSMISNPKQENDGLFILRTIHNEDAMLRACYGRAHATDMLGTLLTLGRSVSAEEARGAYYRVTGRPFNSAPVPIYSRGRLNLFSSGPAEIPVNEENIFDFDNDLASQAVGGVARGLSLTHSNLDVTVDANAAVSKTDWTMEFASKSKQEHEARAQVLLPPGGVVSQAILWVNGVPKQAAFAGRLEARRAYENVVRPMRDPLLVTTSGPDRVLIQCFPVSAGKDMKIRFSITAPMVVARSDQSYSRLIVPQFAERNFQVQHHVLKIKATTPLTESNRILLAAPASVGVSRPLAPGLLNYAFSATVANKDLSTGGVNANFVRQPSLIKAWSESPPQRAKSFSQSLRSVSAYRKPKNLVVVVDGSASMASHVSDLVKVLQALPEGMRVSLIRSGDSVEVLAENLISASPEWNRALEQLQRHQCIGGADAVPSLVRAWTSLHKLDNPAILWIHGTQPIELQAPVGLRSLLVARDQVVQLYDFQIEYGPNRVLESLEGLNNVHVVARLEDSLADLQGLYDQWQGVPTMQAFTVMVLGAGSPADYKSTVSLAPLWAKDQIDKLLLNQANSTVTVASTVDSGNKWRNPAAFKKALAIAKEYRIISPVSGAVVLENKKDYKDNGLEAPPEEGSEIPTRPEPETWLLLLVGLGVLFISLRRRCIAQSASS